MTVFCPFSRLKWTSSTFLSLLLSCAAVAQEVIPDLAPPSEEEDKNHPMVIPQGLDPQVSDLLFDYFEKGVGGYEGWAAVESLRYSGTLFSDGLEVPFTAYQKKPDFLRINLDSPSGRVVMAFDGALAWRMSPALSGEPEPMPTAEAQNFMRDAIFGSHLLYPDIPGKTFEHLGYERVSGRNCHRIRVSLPTGEEVEYFVDIETFYLRQQIATDAVSGQAERVVFDEFQVVAGQPIAFYSRIERGGAFVHELRFTDVDPNLGAMPWMFSPPGLPQKVEVETSLIDPRLSDSLPGVETSEATALEPPILTGESALEVGTQ